MFKYLVVLAAVSTMSSPVLAQPAQDQSQNQAQPAKPQMVKKRVCEQLDENPYSRLGSRKVCKTIEVPAPASAGQEAQQSSTSNTQGK